MGANPCCPLQLVDLPHAEDVPANVKAWVDRLTSIHNQVAANLKVSYDKYEAYANHYGAKANIGDLVWAICQKIAILRVSIISYGQRSLVLVLFWSSLGIIPIMLGYLLVGTPVILSKFLICILIMGSLKL